MEPTPHWGREPIFVLSTWFCTKGRPFSYEYNDSGDPGVIVHTLLSCFLAHVYSTLRQRVPPISYGLTSIYSAQGHPRQSWQTAFWLKSYIASRQILLFYPDRFVSREPLSSTGNHWGSNSATTKVTGQPLVR